MGKCSSTITEVRFVIEDELTQCYVAVRAEGDCPLGVQGWHHKTFPASTPIDQIIPEMGRDYLAWSQEAPKRTA